jgi:hypothetical protein
MSDVLRNPADRPATPPGSTAPASVATTSPAPPPELSDLTETDLRVAAESLGMNPDLFKSRQHLVAAIHQRRAAIAATDAEAFEEAMTWAGRWVPPNATKEQLAAELSHVRSMRFGGLTQRGLTALAVVRGIPVRGDETTEVLKQRLKKQEGWFAKLARKRRALLGSIVSNMIGDTGTPPPPPSGSAPAAPPSQPLGRPATIKHDIEDAGLLGGLAGRVKRSADTYVNQKLDEIEARIDRKLDDIDRRLAEWRDKEIANRVRILKITLWVSIVVGAFSLVYAYIQIQFHPDVPATPTSTIHAKTQH